MNRPWLWTMLGVAALGLAALALNRNLERSKSEIGEGSAVVGRRDATGRPSWWLVEIPTRRVDSAARANYEGIETDGWDALSAEGRRTRVTETVASLEQQIEAATSDDQREALRDQALQVLAAARSDFFVDPEAKQWYLRREANLDAE